MLTKPLLVSPEGRPIALSKVDQPIATLVDGTDPGVATGAPVSAGYIEMRPGAVSAPHCHPATWVYVLLWSSGPLGAITMYGEEFEGLIHQQPGELLVIPPGVPHAAANPSPSHGIRAFEFRGNPSFHADNVVRDDLRPHLLTQMPVLFDIPSARPGHRRDH